jgi:hypothetical protein
MAGTPFQAHPCLCPWMDGSRAMQELLPRDRVWADPDMGAILTIKGLVWGRRFWLLFSLERKVTRALTR